MLTRLLFYLLSAVSVSVGFQHASAAQQPVKTATPATDTLEQLPGYASYQKIEQSKRMLAGAGRVFKLRLTVDGNRLLFDKDQRTLQLRLSDGTIEPAAARQQTIPLTNPKIAATRPVARAQQQTRERSPDRKWLARYTNFNVVLQPADGNVAPTIALTTEGNERLRFGTGCWVYGEELDQDTAMWWSDDSQKLAFYEINEEGMRDYALTIDNAAKYTRVESIRYPKAGSANPKVGLWVYDVASATLQKLEVAGPQDQYLFNIRFAPDSHTLLVNRMTRRQDRLDVLAIDVDSGSVRTVVSEQQKTWQEFAPEMRFLADGRTFIWATERTGWKQFERRHLDGRRVNGLSDNASYPVSKIVDVNEQAGWFYYSAFSAKNPYSLQLHRCRLNGSECSRVTSSSLTHSDFRISPDHRFITAKRQRLDVPVSTVVYRMDGSEVAVLAEGSNEAASKLGLSPPELFSFTADDGQTEIFGTLHKPSNFSPDKTYPLLIDVYGGPQSSGIDNAYQPANAICEFGFLVAKVGNRGTIGRGKAFESANYLRLGVPDLDDQAAAVRFLVNRSYVDGDRVGIFGHSYGGYLAALAMLRYPDVFHVAVAGAPVTDWRNYDSIYTERYMGLPNDNPGGYAAGSCVALAQNLQGHLLLVHGLIDDNVHPANTWQLVNALHGANKRFDLMIYPGFKHGVTSTYDALRWEYLHRHLKPSVGSN